jgi:hypothetical protein
MSEDVETHAQELEKISQRSEDLILCLAQIYQGLVESYKTNFMLEEFVRFLHDAKPL